jgi:phosphatidylglycerophosphate synthase
VGSYSRFERLAVNKIQQATEVLFSPLVRLLVALHVSPHLISLLQPVLGVVMVFTVAARPRLTLALFVTALVVDGLDGTLARATGRASAYGALVDQVCDHAREVLVVAGLARIGALSPFWATLYALAYPGTNVILLQCSREGVSPPLAIKTFVTFYPALVLYLWPGINYLTPAAIAAVGFMLLTIADGLRRLRHSM